MTQLGIGIIGSGFMGRTYAETVSKYARRASLRAVAVGSRAAELAGIYNVAHEPSLDSLLGRKDVDAVFIATPHHVHAQQALAAAKAGKHILLEKPMACSVADCDAIIAACKSANVKCTIAFTQRSRKCNIRAKQIIDAGEIGRVLQIQEFALNATGLVGLPRWQSDAENLGTLFGHAIHNFDRIRWLTGQEIRTVYARCTNLEALSTVASAPRGGRHPQEVPASTGGEVTAATGGGRYGTNVVEGTSMVLMTLADGATAGLWESFQVPKPSFPRTQFAAWIIGEKGLLDIDAYGELRVATDGEWRVAETQEPIDWQGKGFLDPVRLESYTRQCQDFIDAVLDDREPMVTGRDGRQAVAAALAAYESSCTGEPQTAASD